MKKSIVSSLMIIFFMTSFFVLASNSIDAHAAYSVKKAQSYAKKYYKEPNYKHDYFSNDCTNFVSQIINAGGEVQKAPAVRNFGVDRNTSYWYGGLYTKGKIQSFSYSSTFTAVTHFDKYWSSKKKTYTSSSKKNIIKQAEAGDVILMQHEKKKTWSHAMFVYKKTNSTLKLSGHTKSRLDLDIKKLSTYKKFKVIKFAKR